MIDGALTELVQAHVAEQIKRFDDQTTESHSKRTECRTLVFMDPACIDIGIERQRAAIQQYSDCKWSWTRVRWQKMLDVASKLTLA